jgi:hypothetical protein
LTYGGSAVADRQARLARLAAWTTPTAVDTDFITIFESVRASRNVAYAGFADAAAAVAAETAELSRRARAAYRTAAIDIGLIVAQHPVTARARHRGIARVVAIRCVGVRTVRLLPNPIRIVHRERATGDEPGPRYHA